MAGGGSIDWGRMDWGQFISLVLGGIGTALGIGNALALWDERREKLDISWLNCTIAEALFTKAETERIDAQYQRARQGNRDLPDASAAAWIGTLKERFIRAEILLRDKRGKEIVVGGIQIDDWVVGERLQQSSLPGPVEMDFRAFDLQDGTPVNLSKVLYIAPKSTVGLRIEMYERSRHGPVLPGGSSQICPLERGPKTEILLRAEVADGQCRIVLKRIPLTPAEDIPRPPQWWAYERKWPEGKWPWWESSRK